MEDLISARSRGIARRNFMIAGVGAAALSVSNWIVLAQAASKPVNPDDPNAFNHRFFDVNGIRIHAVDEGKGPLIILVHGIPYLWYWWRRQIPALTAAGYRVLAPDLRGFGQSQCPADVESYSIFDAVGDLADLMQAVGENSAIIMGHDLGSWVARSAVELRPDLFTALVMVNSPIGPRDAIKPSDLWKQIRAQTGKRFYHDYLQTGGEEMNKDIRKTLRGTFYSVSGSAVGNGGKGIFSRLRTRTDERCSVFFQSRPSACRGFGGWILQGAFGQRATRELAIEPQWLFRLARIGRSPEVDALTLRIHHDLEALSFARMLLRTNTGAILRCVGGSSHASATLLTPPPSELFIVIRRERKAA